ncbi:MAG: iron-containing alcohol dehydrogenase [Opitutaceae bacterium]|jgi:alcohol dehydrogenase class IV|nr:iron-containing alcohol dehydrogenase [Opitutaceae bacterium]
MISQFNVPATIIAGGGASQEVGRQLLRLGATRVLLVTDAFMIASGVAEKVTAELERAGLAFAVFGGVQPDPTDADVQEGLAALRRLQGDAIVALGGGSPIDAAKAIAVLAQNPEPLSTYQGYHKLPRAGVPLVAIPTTAGTGSEVTKVAVITDTARDVKMMMLDRHFLPTVALVDFELTLSMPPALTAHVGVDTLTHGIEAYVSRKATALTDPLALTCIRLVAEHLETAWREPSNRAAREGMMLAATVGGMAFANSSVALVHGMSRPIGAVFHVPHGLSNAVLLPAVTRFSLVGAAERFATVARTMGLATVVDSADAAGEKLIAGLAALNARLAVPRLGECRGVTRERFDALKAKMAEDALASGSPGNNPVVPTAEQIVALYDEAF